MLAGAQHDGLATIHARGIRVEGRDVRRPAQFDIFGRFRDGIQPQDPALRHQHVRAARGHSLDVILALVVGGSLPLIERARRAERVFARDQENADAGHRLFILIDDLSRDFAREHQAEIDSGKLATGRQGDGARGIRTAHAQSG